MARSFILSKPKACKVDSINVMSLDDALRQLAAAVGEDAPPISTPNDVAIPPAGEKQPDVLPVRVIGLLAGEKVVEREMFAPAAASAVKTSSMKFAGYRPAHDIAKIGDGVVYVDLVKDVSKLDVVRAAEAAIESIPHWDDIAAHSKSSESINDAARRFLSEMPGGLGEEIAIEFKDSLESGTQDAVMTLLVSDIVVGYEPNGSSAAACLVSTLLSNADAAVMLVNKLAMAEVSPWEAKDVPGRSSGIFSLIPMHKVKMRVKIIPLSAT